MIIGKYTVLTGCPVLLGVAVGEAGTVPVTVQVAVVVTDGTGVFVAVAEGIDVADPVALGVGEGVSVGGRVAVGVASSAKYVTHSLGRWAAFAACEEPNTHSCTELRRIGARTSPRLLSGD